MATNKKKWVAGSLALLLFVTPSGFVHAQSTGGNFNSTQQTVYVNNTQSLELAVKNIKPGQIILAKDGNYKDAHLIVNAKGTKEKPVVIRAENGGKAKITGNAKVEIRGDYITFQGFRFEDGKRKVEEWQLKDPDLSKLVGQASADKLKDMQTTGKHGPGLISIWGDNNRITDVSVSAFNDLPTSWVSTSLDKKKHVPQGNRIDHCSFTGKTTEDQVININNSWHNEGNKTPMLNRIDHCYFQNPPKFGNAGGGIRLGYSRSDIGKNLVDHNLFERQDSEPEIVTSKSQYNVFWANTIRDCRGTLNFRHGDHNYAFGNYFLSTPKGKADLEADIKRYKAENKKMPGERGFGGMFVWGEQHYITNNYFQLNPSDYVRGNAAIDLNPGVVKSAHAQANHVTIADNIFADMHNYNICLDAYYLTREKAYTKSGEINKLKRTSDNSYLNNIFYAPKGHEKLVKGIFIVDGGNVKNSAWKTDKGTDRHDYFKNNFCNDIKLNYGGIQNAADLKGFSNAALKAKNIGEYYKIDTSVLKNEPAQYKIEPISEFSKIQGIDKSWNLNELAHRSVYAEKPLYWNTNDDVGPTWLRKTAESSADKPNKPDNIKTKYVSYQDEATGIKVQYSQAAFSSEPKVVISPCSHMTFPNMNVKAYSFKFYVNGKTVNPKIPVKVYIPTQNMNSEKLFVFNNNPENKVKFIQKGNYAEFDISQSSVYGLGVMLVDKTISAKTHENPQTGSTGNFGTTVLLSVSFGLILLVFYKKRILKNTESKEHLLKK